MNPNSDQAYLTRGVSATKDDVKRAVAQQDRGIFPGSFCRISHDVAGDPDWCSVVHADGAGTKSSAAYLMFRETGDPGWFAGIAQDALVMNTDDLLCIGATGPFYVSNTIGRNAHRIPGEIISEIINSYTVLAERMGKFGVEIVLNGGETADVGDLVQTIICDSTVMTRLPRAQVINAANIKPDQAIVALGSFGQATYETKENSGIGSNGLTAARHLLLHSDYRMRYPESYANTIPEDRVYCGAYHLADHLPNSSLTVGEAILSPTRTFLPPMKRILDQYRDAISGLIHCTGGGLIKCKDFSRNIRYVKDNLFPRPAIFDAIATSSEISDREMYQVFNLGQRLEIYCQPEVAAAIIAEAEKFSIPAQIIGHTETSNHSINEVIIKDRGNVFHF